MPEGEALPARGVRARLASAGARAVALATHGVSIVFLLHALGQAMRLGSSVVTTRLLGPETFGAVGITFSVAFTLALLSDIGVIPFLVRSKRDDAAFLGTLWLLRLARNIVLSAIMFVGAGVFASAMGAPELKPAIEFFALIFVLEAFATYGVVLAERRKQVVRVSLVEFAHALFVTAATIIGAYFLRSYWAVLIALLLGVLFNVAASFAFFPREKMRFTIDREVAKDLWNFAKYILPASAITLLLTQTDKIVMARFFPMSEVGVFYLAATIALAVRSACDKYVTRVFYPLVAEGHRASEADANRLYYGARRRLFFALAFGVGGLIGGAELLVRAVFDDRFLGAAPYLSLLSVATLLRLSTFPAEQLFNARGFTKGALYANFARLAAVVVAGVAGFFLFGPMGAVVAINLAELAALPVYWFHVRRFGALSLKEEGLMFAAAAAGAGLGFGLSFSARALIEAGLLPSF